ncbi:O-antigen ligase family protein [Symbiobacterium thermophilum]|uniref:O-antigen ligase family protein n=1 Tax=Symbiobacterium thermophilum TaxID=2734 RepID=UPI00235559F8|nr:O-antigen ligase family protein [Symbiobacterium thermophilum]
MVRSPLLDVWETSLVGRLAAWFLGVWEASLTGRALAALGAFCARVFAGSLIGRFWYSDWPRSGDGDGPVSRALRGLRRLAEAVGRAAGPWLRGLWETSLLVALGGRVARAVGGLLAGSHLWRLFWGYADDVVPAPGEAEDRPTSPVVYLLGLLLGLLPLVPHTLSGLSTAAMIAGVWSLAGLAVLVRFARGEFDWRAPSALLPLSFLLLVVGAAAVQSLAPAASFRNLIIWLTAGLLFWLVADQVRTSRDAAALLGPVLAGAMLMTLWAVYQVFRPPQVEESWVDPEQAGQVIRVFASMGNPNYLAEYMTLLLPPAVGLWLQNPRRQLPLALPVAMMGLTLLLTGSRGGWLATAGALGLFVLLRFRRWTVFLALGGLALLLAAPDAILTRLLSAFSLADTSNQYRVNIWIGVLAMLREHWVLGVGAGAEAFAKGYQAFMLSEARAAHAHNVPLEIFAEMGILGLIAAVWALLAALRRPFVVGADRQSSYILAAVPCALTGLLVHGLVDYVWYNPKILFAFWALAGLGAGLAAGHRKERAT